MANYKTIPVAKPRNSKQKNTVFSVGTSDFGRLQPIATFEVVPGDKISLNLRSFLRGAPPSVPVYGRINVHTDAFFVPYRLLWSDWNNYIAGNTDSTPPYTTIDNLMKDVKINGTNGGPDVYADGQEFLVAQDAERVMCGLKYPKQLFYSSELNQNYKSKRLSTLPIRAYKKIWWDYYRDSVNIVDSTESTYITTAGGSASATSVDRITMNPEVMYRCYGKDYLTTALPNANGGNIPAQSDGAFATGIQSYGLTLEQQKDVYYNPLNTMTPQEGGVGIPIQAIRAANALQRYMEKNNIVGTRLISRLLARFGVAPSAERMQRSEYLGSHKFVMNVSDIDSTESTELENADDVIYNAFGSSESFANIRGQATGKLTGGLDGQTFSYSASEFGIIIILQSIMPDESYYQGVDRSLIRGLSTPNSDRFDFFTPEFESLGYQPVLASDVFIPDDDANPSFKQVYDSNKVFGYQPRYHDYKFMRHMLFGDFTSNVFSTGLDSFHLFRDLSFFQGQDTQSEMVVSKSFNQLGIDERIRYDRIFQIPLTYVDLKIGTAQSSETLSRPATLDHFQLFNRIEYSAMRPMDGDDMPELVAGENDAEGSHISVPNGGIRM